MNFETKDMAFVKNELHSVMKHLLGLLREILATIHEERIIFAYNEIPLIQNVLNRRQQLMADFDHCFKKFVHFLHEMTQDLDAQFSLIEGLEWLQPHLSVDEFELLLLTEQLLRIGKEMQIETRTLLSFLENKSPFSSLFSAPISKNTPKPNRLAIGVMDETEKVF